MTDRNSSTINNPRVQSCWWLLMRPLGGLRAIATVTRRARKKIIFPKRKPPYSDMNFVQSTTVFGSLVHHVVRGYRRRNSCQLSWNWRSHSPVSIGVPGRRRRWRGRCSSGRSWYARISGWGPGRRLGKVNATARRSFGGPAQCQDKEKRRT